MDEKIRERLDEIESSESSLSAVDTLKEHLLSRIRDLNTSSEGGRHRLNMLIRELDEELDRLENQKLGDWDPESG
jgi:chromosome segregation ATPase